MKKFLYTILASCFFLVSCNDEENEGKLYNMFLSIEVTDNNGINLLSESSSIINDGKTKVIIEGKEYYLDRDQGRNSFIFRRMLSETHSYLMIGSWYNDCTNEKIIIEWGGSVTDDTIVFSYDSPLDGMQSEQHDFRYPYSITVNGESLEFNKERGRYVYVKK